MSSRFWIMILCMGGLFLSAVPVSGQSLSERISQIRRANAVKKAGGGKVSSDPKSPVNRVKTILVNYDVEGLTAKQAIEWLSNVGGVTIIVHWNKLEEMGIDPNQQVRLYTGGVTVEKSLELILRQIAIDEPLMWEVTPWYVEVMTKSQANSKSSVVVYPIGDLLMKVPSFTDAPDFDLVNITGNRGLEGGQDGQLFEGSDEDETDVKTKEELANDIIQLIRDTVEPDIWRASGGLAGSITLWRDSLVIRAPAHVHRQIGGVTPSRVAKPASPIGALKKNPNVDPKLIAKLEAEQRESKRDLQIIQAVIKAGRLNQAVAAAKRNDPSVSVVSSGSLLDVTGTASQDRRYVTMTGGFTNARIIRLRQIPVFGGRGGLGFGNRGGSAARDALRAVERRAEVTRSKAAVAEARARRAAAWKARQDASKRRAALLAARARASKASKSRSSNAAAARKAHRSFGIPIPRKRR